jgi:hypothetical protein
MSIALHPSTKLDIYALKLSEFPMISVVYTSNFLFQFLLGSELGEFSCQFLPPGGNMVPRNALQLLFSLKITKLL